MKISTLFYGFKEYIIISSVKNLIACTVMVFGAVCSAREIYQEYIQNEGYTSSGTSLGFGAEDLSGTAEFLYAIDRKVICLKWDRIIVWESPALGGSAMVLTGDAIFTTTYQRFPDRHGVALVSDKGEVLWQKETGIVFPGALDASYDLLAAGTREGVLWTFSRDGDILYTFENNARIDEVAVAPDSSCVIFTDYREFVKCVRNGELIWARTRGEIPLKGLKSYILAFSPDSSYIVYGSNKDKPRIVVCAPDGKVKWSYPLEDVPKSIAITPDSQYIVAGCRRYVYKFSCSSALMWTTAVGEDNLYLAVTTEYTVVGSSHPYRLFVLDEEGTILWKAKSRNYIRAVYISPSGEYVAFSNNDGDLFIISNPPESDSVQ